MKYCTQCGIQLADDAAFCTQCGAAQAVAEPQAPIYTNDQPPVYTNDQPPVYQPPVYDAPVQPEVKKNFTPLVLGILGIIFAWLFALVGHVLSIIGIITGAAECKRTGNASGLVVSIIGEACAILSSFIGIIISMNSLF